MLPEWSQNSTIVPIRKENGDLMYVDFSHGNAYDTLARPFVTLLNNIQKGEDNEKSLLDSFVRGSIEAFGELSDPFISESIFTEAMNDFWFRGGEQKMVENYIRIKQQLEINLKLQIYI